MSIYLKCKQVEVNGCLVDISQISGYDRFEYLEWMSLIQEPEIPIQPDDNASLIDRKAYTKLLAAADRAWARISFNCQCRLIAHSFCQIECNKSQTIEDTYQRCLTNLSLEDAKTLHDEIAILSGMQLNRIDDSEKAKADSDPKN